MRRGGLLHALVSVHAFDQGVFVRRRQVGAHEPVPTLTGTPATHAPHGSGSFVVLAATKCSILRLVRAEREMNHHAFHHGAVLDAVQGAPLRSAPAGRGAFGP